ncbi:MAG TPA: sigma-70 family RNA polymerase sigma factor [Planctomycetota bacterium]|nr:sigma-70 family RNA polymerase sigma factor [Planctomycetota bacterium]
MPDPTTSCSPSAIDFPRKLDAARRGNRSAQEALFERYYSQVERIVHAQLRRGLRGRRLCLASRFSTADVVQDVFHSLLTSLRGFSGASEGEFVAWVVKIIRSRTLDTIRHHGASCRDYRRSLGNVDEDSMAGLAAARATETASSTQADLLGSYTTALESLPEPARRLLRARIEEGLGFEALARELGYPSRYAARRAFFAAQARLIMRLRSAGAALPAAPSPA